MDLFSISTTLPSHSNSTSLSVAVRHTLPAFSLDLSFTAPPGVTIVFGPSGAGKTTLLDCIAGLTAPSSGRIALGGETLFDDTTNLPPSRRRIGYVFQTLALFPHLTAEQNIAYGVTQDRSARVAAILESFRISAVRARKPADISGGERQRVALARALVTDPRGLLLDEPLSALDAATKSRIMDDLRAWNQAHGIPILYVTHSREEVFALGERVVALESGRIIAQGTPSEVLDAPRRESLAQSAGFENILDVTVTALHHSQGTMSCRLSNSPTELEVPLGRAAIGDRIRVGLRAGDILLASRRPEGLSARNLIESRVVSVEQRDVTVIVCLDCGVLLQAHVTPAARDALHLRPGATTWAVIKTHSCHPLQPTG